MPGPDSLSSLGTFVLMLPFGLLLAMSIFGMDKRFAAPKRRKLQIHFCELEPDGQPDMADPDGHPWQPSRHHEGAQVRKG